MYSDYYFTLVIGNCPVCLITRYLTLIKTTTYFLTYFCFYVSGFCVGRFLSRPLI